MKLIASFTVDHDKLKKGMYISRVDGDIVTYDVRMAVPNSGEYLALPAMHTIEHLFATCARNGELGERVVYIGPMGCLTGFYLLTRDLPHQAALDMTRECMRFIADYQGAIPGAAASRECGNYKMHDLDGARSVARDMLAVLENWTVEKLDYDAAH